MSLTIHPAVRILVMRFLPTASVFPLRLHNSARAVLIQQRSYAKKASKVTSTASLIPGSLQPLISESSREEYSKTEGKMKVAVEWYRKECAAIETRASGRVTPAVLSPVRVVVPEKEGEGGGSFRLEDVATVGVREGSTILITPFEEKTIKYIEQALYDSKIPGIVPQRVDSRTIKIPIPKPTIEARTAAYAVAHRQAEDTRVQVRKLHQAALKRGKWAKHSVEIEEFQKLTDRFVGETDRILANLKKVTTTDGKR